MTSEQFAPGQRWISNTESELGLGIVEASAERRVVMGYPAAGESRTYAADNAPLTRVIYSRGEQIRAADGRELTVEEQTSEDGCIVYVGTDAGGELAVMHEASLAAVVRFSKPQDRLFAGRIDRNRLFRLRADTLVHRHRHLTSSAFGLLGPRVQLLPHQLYIAGEVGRRRAPRVLLADEVGLGKTIESGLILHQQLLAGLASRVLVVVPDNLVHQWLVEMLRRFNLRFTILDEQRCRELAPDAGAAENPFESAQLVLCPLELLAGDPARTGEAVAAGWDVLVVDEAHRLRFGREGAGREYRCIEALATTVPGVLLLTATPESVGAEAHFARLRLLDPARYGDRQRFEEEQHGYRELADLVDALAPGAEVRDLDALGPQVARYLGAEAREELHRAAASAESLESIVARLLDCHGTGRVLYRNARERIGGFPGRRLIAHPLVPPAGYRDVIEDPAAALRPEILLGPDWVAADPRVPWLVEFLRERRSREEVEKVVVILAGAGAAQSLEAHLRTRGGARTALFHEGMSLVARDRAAAYFSAPDPESAQVLVCSEIGGEGRNFQAARHLVLMDLPRDPDILEQRIGRLDRIGQRHRVEIHVPVYLGSAQAVLVRWYDEGLDAFAQTCPAAAAIHEQLGSELDACLAAPLDVPRLDVLVERTAQAARAHAARLRAGRDRLLERTSFDPERGGELALTVAAATRELDLVDYFESLLDGLGVEQERQSTHCLALRPGDHMVVDSIPDLPEDGATVTFNRAEALARDDLRFMTWEHPMVTGAMDLVLHGGVGSTAFCTLTLPGVKPGTLFLEALYVPVAPSRPGLQLGRYLTEGVVRIVVDSGGNELAEVLTRERLDRLAENVPTRSAQEFLRHVRSEVARLVERADAFAEPRRAALAAAASTRAEETLGHELRRMRDLARVNPAVSPGELAALEATIGEVRAGLGETGLRLDALRVAVTT